MLMQIIGRIAPPALALAAAVSLSGCNGEVSINGDKGVPLSELATEGKSPTGLVLAGPDRVTVVDGDTLRITVSGDPAAVEALRFTLDGDTIGIMRKKDGPKGDAQALVTVTMPRLETITLAGSGRIDAPTLAGDAEVTIAGSGVLETKAVQSQELDVTIAGSGTYRAAGKAASLDLTIAGSGTAEMAGLAADKADVTIAGSGTAAFASDGTVEAMVMGSGTVTVSGKAKCTIKSMGSGTLRCANGTAAPAAPAPPAPPAGPPPVVLTPPAAAPAEPGAGE